MTNDPDDMNGCSGECAECPKLDECQRYGEVATCGRCKKLFPCNLGYLHDNYDGESICEDCYDDLGGVMPPVREQYPMHTVHFTRDENNRIVVDNA